MEADTAYTTTLVHTTGTPRVAGCGLRVVDGHPSSAVSGSSQQHQSVHKDGEDAHHQQEEAPAIVERDPEQLDMGELPSGTDDGHDPRVGEEDQRHGLGESHGHEGQVQVPVTERPAGPQARPGARTASPPAESSSRCRVPGQLEVDERAEPGKSQGREVDLPGPADQWHQGQADQGQCHGLVGRVQLSAPPRPWIPNAEVQPPAGKHHRQQDDHSAAEEPLPPFGVALVTPEMVGQPTHLQAGLGQGDDHKQQDQRSDSQVSEAEVGPEVEPCPGVGPQQPDQHGPNHGHGQVPQGTEGGGRECDDHHVVEGGGIESQLGGDEDASQRPHHGTQRPRRGRHHVGAGAVEGGQFPVVHHRPHGRADTGAAQQETHRHGNGDSHREHDEPVPGKLRRTQVDTVVDAEQIRHSSWCIGFPDVANHRQQQHHDRHRDHELHHQRSGAQPPHDHRIKRHSQRRGEQADHHEQGEDGMPAPVHVELPVQERREHPDGALGEVEHPGSGVDHHQPGGVHRPQRPEEESDVGGDQEGLAGYLGTLPGEHGEHHRSEGRQQRGSHYGAAEPKNHGSSA